MAVGLLVAVMGWLSMAAADEGARQKPPLIRPTKDSIALFTRRVQQHPNDYLSQTMLGRLHLRHARVSDDFSSFQRAMRAFQAALAVEPGYLPAKIHLAQAHAAQHQFAQAIELSEQVLKAQPDSAGAWATLGDARLELGHYSRAGQAYQKLIALGQSPGILARLARWHELHGDTERALALLRKARAQQDASAGLPEQLAWYDWRLGRHEFSLGHLQEAARHFQSALAQNPNDVHALAGLAQVQAAQGDDAAAITLYQRAISIRPEPPLLAGLAAVYTQLGNLEQAASYLDRAEAGMAEEAKDPASAAAHRRELARFYTEHDRHLAQALHLARQEIGQRQDIDTYDTLAWALYKNGHTGEANAAINKALQLGTQDARLWYHAGMIHLKLGERDKGIDYLRKAVQRNRYFSLQAVQEIQKILSHADS